MLEGALTKTFGNLATLVLVALVVTGPIHLVHAYVFKDVLAVQELAPEIRSGPEKRQVRGVAPGDLDAEKNFLLLAVGAELLLLPLIYRAARRVLSVDDQGGVPGVIDAWTHLQPLTAPSTLAPVAGAAALGIISAALLWVIGTTVAGMGPPDLAWSLFGFSRATAVALAGALITGVAAALTKNPSTDPQPADVY